MPRRAADAGVRVGTAGWSIPRASSPRFPGPGTHLERYARVFAGVEINSSFHRPHAVSTYASWHDQTPDGFRFAVKLPRTITHDLRLVGTRRPLEAFLQQCRGLGGKRGPLLVQLPPSLAFTRAIATRFFRLLRSLDDGAVVVEPRHASWFSAPATAVLDAFRLARVAADPPPVPGAETPAGFPGIAYFRWHGSPHRYWSAYGDDALAVLAAELERRAGGAECWCVFDNTATGAAIENAWDLQQRLRRATRA